MQEIKGSKQGGKSLIQHNLCCIMAFYVKTGTLIQPNLVKVNEIFKICHEGLTAGQRGLAGTIHKFQRTFFIMSAREKTRRLVEPCDVCLAKERSIKGKRVPHEPSTVGNVGEKVFIDCYATLYANEHELFIPEEVSIHPCN